MSLITKSEYKGSEVVKIAKDPAAPWPFSFGAAKASLLLEALVENPALFLETCTDVAGERVTPELAQKIEKLSAGW